MLISAQSQAFNCKDIQSRQVQITKLHELDTKSIGVQWAYNGMDDLSLHAATDAIHEAYEAHMNDLKAMADQMGCK
jgi:hypothetical protein